MATAPIKPTPEQKEAKEERPDAPIPPGGNEPGVPPPSVIGTSQENPDK